MEGTLPGDRMARVPNPVEAECNLEEELAPIRHQHTVERTAVDWGQVILLENVPIRDVQVC